jgi:hypothetical protein
VITRYKLFPFSLGQRYLLVVTCHDTGRLVWAGKDRTKQTLGRFFDDLGAERAADLCCLGGLSRSAMSDLSYSARAPKIPASMRPTGGAGGGSGRGSARMAMFGDPLGGQGSFAGS